MILPKTRQSVAAVADHYNELDRFYREIWGEHVHHGYWRTGRETPEVATEALIGLVAERLALAPGHEIVDIGCGYGATAARLAKQFDARVTGFTVSAVQAAIAQAREGITVICQDWLANGLEAAQFDRGYAIESSEHMPDKNKFFAEAFRTIKPGGRLVLAVWLAGDAPTAWEVRHLLEPICREGRLPSMGTGADYDAMAVAAGFVVAGAEDISAQVSKTWWICLRRVLRRLATTPRYWRFLLDQRAHNRVFLFTLPRLIAAYWTGAMRYSVRIYQRP